MYDELIRCYITNSTEGDVRDNLKDDLDESMLNTNAMWEEEEMLDTAGLWAQVGVSV